MKKIFVLLILVACVHVFPSACLAKNISESALMERLDYLKENTNWLTSYKPNVFDCSNMSTLLTWNVEAKTRIARLPFVSKEDNDRILVHCVVEVQTDNVNVWIDPVTLDKFNAKLFPAKYFYNPTYFDDYKDAIEFVNMRGRDGEKEFGVPLDYVFENLFRKADFDVSASQ